MAALLGGEQLQFLGINVVDVVEKLFEETLGTVMDVMPNPKAVEEIIQEHKKFSSMYGINLNIIYNSNILGSSVKLFFKLSGSFS